MNKKNKEIRTTRKTKKWDRGKQKTKKCPCTSPPRNCELYEDAMEAHSSVCRTFNYSSTIIFHINTKQNKQSKIMSNIKHNNCHRRLIDVENKMYHTKLLKPSTHDMSSKAKHDRGEGQICIVPMQSSGSIAHRTNKRRGREPVMTEGMR